MPKPAELRLMDDEELESRLAEARQELFNLRFQLVTGQLDNTGRLGQLRKQVAQVKTIQREREIAAWEELYGAPGAAVAGAPAGRPEVETEEEEPQP